MPSGRAPSEEPPRLEVLVCGRAPPGPRTSDPDGAATRLLAEVCDAILGRRVPVTGRVRAPSGRPNLLVGQDSMPGPLPSLSASSAGGFHAVAACTAGPAGVDVEPVDPSRFRADLSPHLLALVEAGAYRTVEPDQRTRWLAAVWTRKEAALKALDLGLAIDPRDVVTVGPLRGSAPLPQPTRFGAQVRGERPVAGWTWDFGELVVSAAYAPAGSWAESTDPPVVRCRRRDAC